MACTQVPKGRTGFEVCTVTVLANNVSDQDNIDPPDHMTANFVTGFTSTYVMASAFLVVCVLAGTLVPGRGRLADSRRFDQRVATASEPGAGALGQ